MNLILTGIGFLVLASAVLCVVAYGVSWLLGRRPRGYARKVLWAHAVLIPVYAFVVLPGFFGWFGVRNAHTRGDEAAYAGPLFTQDGGWRLQSRESLAAERAARAGEPGGAASPYEVWITAEDGVRLRGFLVPPLGPQQAPTAVVAHGLFRGALEIERVGAMFRELGSEVLLLELRSHGRSGRGLLGFGAFEERDVRAAVAFLRARPGRADDRVVLFGVSLGAQAVLLAAPRLKGLAALCIDAPMDDALSTGRRMLNLPPRQGHRRLALPQPFRSLVLLAAELWAGLDLAAVRPIDAARRLPADLPVLVVGGGDDQRMPPEVVRAVYEALPMQEPTKRLWIREGSDHGAVFVDDPAGYRERLSELIERARGPLSTTTSSRPR
jgi:alpha-beta hydrolase superfamily lysophospholipase